MASRSSRAAPTRTSGVRDRTGRPGAVEAETRHKELQRQLEDAQRRATTPACTAAPGATTAGTRLIPPPTRKGGRNTSSSSQQAALLNERLNMSERDGAPRKIGRGKLNEIHQRVSANSANADPTLFGKLYASRIPTIGSPARSTGCAWCAMSVTTPRSVSGPGQDPRPRRAHSWEAGGQGTQPAPSPARPACSPNLGTARSVAGRTARGLDR